MRISIEKESGLSIYQQLVDQIVRKIQNGELLAGQKLPTVRELADELGIARGTVKHAYEELEHKGAIKMTRGRGTFVCELAAQELSHKSRAMNAIEQFLQEMESMNFSVQETQMLFNLKIRERMEADDSVCIVFVDCNPETLTNIINQISVIPNIESHKLLLEDALNQPFMLEDLADLVVTTSTHAAQLSSILTNKEKLIQVVTTPSSQTVARMATIGEQSVGILCASETFSHIIIRGMQSLDLPCRDVDTYYFSSAMDLESFLRHRDVLIVPNDYLLFCSRAQGDLIRRAGEEGKSIIRYNYQIDGGSFLNVQEKVESVRSAK